MATKTEINNFINKISKYAIAECNKRTKKICPSVCIAQGAIESAWGTSATMVKSNALFGIKATSAWINKGKKVYNTKTKEVYGGKTVSITDCFRAYDSVAESVSDYYDLITGVSYYSKAINEPDSTKAIKAIKAGGYCTDPDYVSKVTSIIKTYNLTKYDDCMKTKTTTTSNKTSTTTTKKETKVTMKKINNVVTANILNIRQSASNSAKIVGTLKKNDVVEITKVSGVWFYITKTSKHPAGWIHKSFIKTTTGVTTDSLNVRTLPNTGGKIISTIKNGTKVKLIGVKGEWYFTEYGGYSSGKYFK